MQCCPAHTTKHQALLQHHPFVLAQSQDGVANGTTLWLGGQCLDLYLAHEHARFSSSASPRTRPCAFELGSGIGLTALSLASRGWDVVATDIPHVISAVLRNNIRNNQHVLPPGSGHIHLCELDWLVPPELWRWHQHPAQPALSPSSLSLAHPSLPPPPYDLVYTADTVYDPALVSPLLRSLHALCSRSAAASPASRSPPVLLCLERRDPALVDRFLDEAARVWNFAPRRIPHKKLARVVQKHNPHWSKEDWQGVELWMLSLISIKKKSHLSASK